MLGGGGGGGGGVPGCRFRDVTSPIISAVFRSVLCFDWSFEQIGAGGFWCITHEQRTLKLNAEGGAVLLQIMEYKTKVLMPSKCSS